MKRQQKFLLTATIALAFQTISFNTSFAQTSDTNSQTHTITISGFAFKPDTLTVHTGDTVTWKNNDNITHNVTFTKSNNATIDVTLLKTGDLQDGQSGQINFTQPGTYAYICTYHPGMTGTITVK